MVIHLWGNAYLSVGGTIVMALGVALALVGYILFPPKSSEDVYERVEEMDRHIDQRINKLIESNDLVNANLEILIHKKDA